MGEGKKEKTKKRGGRKKGRKSYLREEFGGRGNNNLDWQCSGGVGGAWIKYLGSGETDLDRS